MLDHKNNYPIQLLLFCVCYIGFYLRKFTPQQRGFDHFYGYYTGNEEYWNHTSPCWECGNYTAIDLGYHNATNDVFDLNEAGLYSTNLFSEHAVDVIKTFANDHANDDTELFLYLPFEAVHGMMICIQYLLIYQANLKHILY